MANRYVGPGGNDGNSGLTWPLRKLTLNGVEDTPVVAGDWVYVGPGVYRETLTVDISGGAGTEVVYVGDVTGEHTDGVGGICRITNSNNDQTGARWASITATGRDYRVFRGFLMDLTLNDIITAHNCDNWTVEDCIIQCATTGKGILVDQGGANWTIRRNLFPFSRARAISFEAAGTVDDIGHLVENCMFIACQVPIYIERVGDGIIKNIFISGASDVGVRVAVSPNAGHPWIVNNSILMRCSTALRAAVLGDLVEDYNNFWANNADRNTVAVGGNSVAYASLHQPPIFHAGVGQVSGFKFPWWFGELSEWSQIRAITGNNEPAVDLRGIRRPVTAAKNSWGPCQFQDMEVESGTVQAGTYSRVLHDAGCVLVRRVPVTGSEITVTLYVRRETNYAGDLPRMIVKQPGQADQITVMTAAVNTWEQLSDTFTPASPPGFVEVWVESRNTAAAGNYEVFYDTMDVS